MSNRFKWPLILCGLFAATGLAETLPPVEIKLADDLSETGQQAVKGCRPLLLEFASEYCEYCDLLEDEILKPMLRNRDYDQLVVMRKMLMDGEIPVVDFNTKQTSVRQISDHYKVFVTPTLLFVDHQGNELAERMVGVTTLDFYGGYLDQALEQAKEQLQQQGLCR